MAKQKVDANGNKVRLSTTVSPKARRLLEQHAKKAKRTVSNALDLLLLEKLE